VPSLPCGILPRPDTAGRRLVLCGIERRLYGALKEAKLTELFRIRA
jgi:hypothetical protein